MNARSILTLLVGIALGGWLIMGGFAGWLVDTISHGDS